MRFQAALKSTIAAYFKLIIRRAMQLVIHGGKHRALPVFAALVGVIQAVDNAAQADIELAQRHRAGVVPVTD